MENKTLFFFLVAVLLSADARAADAPAAAEIAPSASSTNNNARLQPGMLWQARFSYITSRTAEHDVRSFRGSATDDTGAVTTGSTLPNFNYVSAGATVSPWRNNTLGFTTLQNIDSPAYRAAHLTGPGGNMNGVYSGRYGYRFNPQWNFGMGETYVTGRKWSDPTMNLNYRARPMDEQGLAPRFGVGLSAPTTERSHNDQLITQATARTGLAFVAGRWTTSGSLAYSRPIYAHPSRLSASNWDDGTNTSGAPGSTSAFNPNAHGGGGGGGGHHHHRGDNATPSDTSTTAATDPSQVYVPNPADTAMAERTQDRTTSSIGVTYRASDHLKVGSGAGVTYVETWRQKAIWMTNARVVSAAYTFWKMEAGSDVQLYSTTAKFQHPSLPSMLAFGLHLTYFMGEDRMNPL